MNIYFWTVTYRGGTLGVKVVISKYTATEELKHRVALQYQTLETQVQQSLRPSTGPSSDWQIGSLKLSIWLDNS